jgi:hypothetical protein
MEEMGENEFLKIGKLPFRTLAVGRGKETCQQIN